MAVTFKELSLIADLHFGKLPDAFKAKASEFFEALDQDGDGAVTLPELLSSSLEGKFGESFIQHVFYHLDEEDRGHLEFRECLTLYYLCMYSARTCGGCSRNIPHGLGYTCLKCLKEGQPPSNEFSVCLECYSSHGYLHDHKPIHLLHDFVLFDNLLHSRPSPPAYSLAPVRTVEQTVKQCIVCGDHHESATRGFMCDVHMSRMRDSTEFVCEWCFSYLCSKCGNLFRDSTTRAEPGKWLQRFVCHSCHQKNISIDCYDASVKRLQKILGGSELLMQCKTCDIKYRNGTLFWIVNSTNLGSAGSAYTPTNPGPAMNTRSRGNSFDYQAQPSPGYSGGSNDNSFRGGGRDGSFRGSRGNDSGGGSDGSSRGGSSSGGSSHGGREGPINRRSRADQAAAQQRAPPPANRMNVNQAAAAAMLSVNRFVNAAGRNLMNAGGGGGGPGGGNAYGGGPGAGNAYGGGPGAGPGPSVGTAYDGGAAAASSFNGGGDGGGGGGGGGDVYIMYSNGVGAAGDDSGNGGGMASDGVDGGGDGLGADGGGGAFDPAALLAGLGNLMSGVGSDGTGETQSW